MLVAKTHSCKDSLLQISFAEGRPLVNETYISPSSMGKTFENSVTQITWSSLVISSLALTLKKGQKYY